MHSHDDVVLGGVGVWHLRQGESTDADGAVSNSDGLHDSPSQWRGFSNFEPTGQSVSLCAAHQGDHGPHSCDSGPDATGGSPHHHPRRCAYRRGWACGPQRSCRHRTPIPCSSEPAAVSKSSSSGRRSPGRAVRGAELATGEGPKALFDAAVARCVPASADMSGVHRLARPVTREPEKATCGPHEKL